MERERDKPFAIVEQLAAEPPAHLPGREPPRYDGLVRAALIALPVAAVLYWLRQPLLALFVFVGGTGLTSWLVWRLWTSSEAQEYDRRELELRLEAQQRQYFSSMKRTFLRLRSDAEVGGLSRRAIEQLELVQSRLREFQRLLIQKFRRGEVTFQRYLDAAERVFRAVIDNLEGVAAKLPTLAGPARAAEADIRATMLAEAREALVRNDEGLAAMLSVIAEVGQLKDADDRQTRDLTAATAELQRLAERAKLYDV